MADTEFDQCMTNCFDMWDWIAEQIKGGNEGSVDDLKQEWLLDNRLYDIENDCFFCHYDTEFEDDCMNCPAILLGESHPENEVWCGTEKFHFRKKPIKFRNKIASLTRKHLRTGVTNVRRTRKI